MARRRSGTRTRTIAFDLNKMTHEMRMHILDVGMEVIGQLAERVAEEANAHAPSIQDWPLLPNQSKRRGPNKHGGSDSGPISNSVFAQASSKVPSSWLVISPAWYSHFVEYGTDAHKMPLKAGKLMSFAGTNASKGKFISTYHVEHTGGARRPFMRPAADKAEQFLDEIAPKIQ